MMKRKKGRGGLAALVFSAIAALTPGCYMEAPHAYLRIDTPHAESKAQPRKVIVHHPAPRQPVITYKNCTTYAASAADSMSPDGHSVTVCTCTDPYNPKDKYTCQISSD